jgi:hypothetical protein
VHYRELADSFVEKDAHEYDVSFYRKMKQTVRIVANGMLIMLALRGLPQFHNLQGQG